MNNQDNLTIGQLSYTNNKDQLIVNMYQKINQMIYLLNNKQNGIYSEAEMPSGGKWYVDRQKDNPLDVRCIVVPCGTLPNSTTKLIPHGLPITEDWKIINFYIVSKNISASPTVEFNYITSFSTVVYTLINNTNISITTTADLSSATESYCTIFYIRP